MFLGISSALPKGPTVTSKFIAIYSKLFQGSPPNIINSQLDQDRFFSDLLDLKVDRSYLKSEFNKTSKERCLGTLKPFLNTLFQKCTMHMRSKKYGDIKMSNAVETLSIFVSCILAKNLTGWEVMEIFAGSVAQSDSMFSSFTEALDVVMGDVEAPGIVVSTVEISASHLSRLPSASVRHQVVQLGLIYMCGTGQLSTGAYFLRRNFFSSIVSVVKTPEMEQYTFEAVVFLAILANYHKSDAAKLNPYLKQIKDSQDGEFMRKLCWVSNYTLKTSIKAYQEPFDDSLNSTIASSIGAVINRWRPDRALSISSEPPRESLKDQPVEATIVLLPIYEFLSSNLSFPAIFLEDLVSPLDPATVPLFSTVVSLDSYLFSHAMSISSPRSIAYAGLSLSILLALVENNVVMEFITQTSSPSIHLCRQRLPVLPPARRTSQPPICSILDCCTLWLRHNLHKRLEIHSYTNCIWICYRAVWFLQNRRLRLDYNWTELWDSLLGLLNFLSSKIDLLHTTGGVELLASETLRLLDMTLCTSESFLSSPQALHGLIYELVRASSTLRKQENILKSLALPHLPNTRPSFRKDPIEDTLGHLLQVVDFFEQKIGTGIENAKDAMKIVADEIEANGLHVTRELQDINPEPRSRDVLDFARVACGDGLALMP